MTKPKRYKRYSPEFKREAIRRASEEGVTDAAIRFKKCKPAPPGLFATGENRRLTRFELGSFKPASLSA